MLERIGLPISFVLLWSSAFVAAKSGVVYATPFAFLAVRFAIVAAIFASVGAGVYVWQKARKKTAKTSPKLTLRSISGSACVGILLHGFYLGCSFYAMANGLGAALTALIVSTQPLLTTALAILLFGEKPRAIQWLGITIGFCGVIVVLSPSLGHSVPTLSLLASIVALIAITGGTLLQKKIGHQVGLLHSNVIQASAATLFFSLFDPYDRNPAYRLDTKFYWRARMAGLGCINRRLYYFDDFNQTRQRRRHNITIVFGAANNRADCQCLAC